MATLEQTTDGDNFVCFEKGKMNAVGRERFDGDWEVKIFKDCEPKTSQKFSTGAGKNQTARERAIRFIKSEMETN